jgi:hypothetical protein
MPTLDWLTREQDLKAAANAEYRLLVEEEKFSFCINEKVQGKPTTLGNKRLLFFNRMNMK